MPPTIDATTGLLGLLAIALVFVIIIAWIGANIGRTFERRDSERRVQSVVAFNRVAESLSKTSQYTSHELLSLVLKEVVQGLEANTGAIFSNDGKGFTFVHSINVSDIASITRAANSPHTIDLLNAKTDHMVAEYLDALSGWSALEPDRNPATLLIRFGRDSGWQGLLGLTWRDAKRADHSIQAALHITRFTSQVLAEIESRYKRGRDVAGLTSEMNTHSNFVAKLGAVAHDAGQPLQAIYNTLAVISLDQPPDRIVISEKVINELKNCVDLIHSYLNADLGQFEFSPESIRIEELLEVVPSLVTGIYHDKLAKHHLRFSIQPEADLPPICGERFNLIRVLSNLLNNATKYNHEGGYIQLMVKKRDAVSALFIVENSGPTIPPDSLPRLFEYGYRVPDAAEAAPRGRGIGLHSCYQIIQAHKGEIWVDSVAGVNRFFFTVPFAK